VDATGAAVEIYAHAKKDKSGDFDAQHRRQAAAAKKVIPVSPKDEKRWWERAVLIQSSLANGADEQEAYARSPLKDQDDPRFSAMKDRCGVDLYHVGGRRAPAGSITAASSSGATSTATRST
jgi:hypothetical protein